MLLGLIAAGCSDSTGSSAPRDITAGAVAGRATAAIAAVITMRADASLTSSYQDQSTVVGRAEAEVDLRAGTVVGESSIDLDPTADEGDTIAEEAVVFPDGAYRREPGQPWEESGQTFVGVVLPVFEQEGDDVAVALRSLVLAAPAPWVATTDDDGTTTYRSSDETSGQTLELDIDDQGHLTRIARSQPPFGTDVDQPQRVGAEIVFREFDATVVALPPDLPAE
jgi:hypothetical protein